MCFNTDSPRVRYPKEKYSLPYCMWMYLLDWPHMELQIWSSMWRKELQHTKWVVFRWATQGDHVNQDSSGPHREHHEVRFCLPWKSDDHIMGHHDLTVSGINARAFQVTQEMKWRVLSIRQSAGTLLYFSYTELMIVRLTPGADCSGVLWIGLTSLSAFVNWALMGSILSINNAPDHDVPRNSRH